MTVPVPSASGEQRTREIERLRSAMETIAYDRIHATSIAGQGIGAILDAYEALLRAREQEAAEANTRLHSLRWLLGLDTHEGEDPISDLEAIANLRALRLNEAATVTACVAVRDADKLRELVTEGVNAWDGNRSFEDFVIRARAALGAEQ